MFLVGIQDFNYAGLRADDGDIISTQMYLPMPTHGSSTADFFNPLVRHIEETVLTGRVRTPPNAPSFTSGMVIAGVESLASGRRTHRYSGDGGALHGGTGVDLLAE